MKKENAYKICYFISVLLVVGFVICIIWDWINYNTVLNSAPFYLGVIVNAVLLLIPAGILFLIGRLLKRKYNK